MKIKPLGKNQTVLLFNEKDYELFFSYETLVAGKWAGKYIMTDKKWSTTTAKHIDNYLQGAPAEKRPQTFFDSL